jgi:hypothetical protein
MLNIFCWDFNSDSYISVTLTKHQSDRYKVLREGNHDYCLLGGCVPMWRYVSNGHLALISTLLLPEHLGGGEGGCKAIELSPF